ncbi:MAG: hypothetical protein HYZ49_15215 [Chloroflexi bacterium]|nr:hypothetical protein [Chloroflexota bacterium]
MNSNMRFSVSNSRLVTALVAGFVATHMATVTGFWYRMIGFNPGEGYVTLSWPWFNGLLLMPTANLTDQPFSAAEIWWAGAVFHTFTGVCFALIYAFLIHPRLPLKNTMMGNLGKALIWAGVLGLVSALWWVPANFPAFTPGFLSLNLGVKTTIGIFIWHAVYGIHLGAFYNPTDEMSK